MAHAFPPFALLAESGDATIRLAMWISVLLIIAVAGFALASLVRKRMNDAMKETGVGSPADFTLSDLRKMRAAGQITEEEFERAKGRIVAMTQAKLIKEAEKKGELIEPTDEVKP
jgi:uncharacterized membrane protein